MTAIRGSMLVHGKRWWAGCQTDDIPGGGLHSGGCQPPAADLTVASESSSLDMGRLLSTGK